MVLDDHAARFHLVLKLVEQLVLVKHVGLILFIPSFVELLGLDELTDVDGAKASGLSHKAVHKGALAGARRARH